MYWFVHRTVKHLLNLDALVPSLSQLYKGHPVAPLITALLSSLLEYHFKSFSENDNVLNVLLSLIEEIKLEEAAAYQLVKWDIFGLFLLTNNLMYCVLCIIIVGNCWINFLRFMSLWAQVVLKRTHSMDWEQLSDLWHNLWMPSKSGLTYVAFPSQWRKGLVHCLYIVLLECNYCQWAHLESDVIRWHSHSSNYIYKNVNCTWPVCVT